ncbi:hypothetical protein [Dolosicoccus paucivorans]|uniref:Uncharacterized protein n=1 Tax=Dolosicoccus paucivorans TaxID=84521 RepID=A0A1G8MVM6_9LACT|nr:hypothetical protein [Dolosicoccus paucivorans]PMB84850.1 hypothetical protein CJ206_01475 [Dolosicoccus paucivorans]PMC58846.1 hypothetical protein CJ205_02015 [Dolosicoccus paucivorans]SDI71380.1 hypothetical protein SAMN04487994_103712 [Dolosicoccus paucivorans]
MNGDLIETVEVGDLKHTNTYQEGYRNETSFEATKDEKNDFEFRHFSDSKSLETQDYADEAAGTVSGEFVAGQMQEITFNYYKQEVVEGTFQEHHKYYDVEKNFEGEEVERTEAENISDEVKKGTEDESFTTQERPKDGYDLVKVEGTEGTNYNQDGTEATDNFVANEKQEVTYTYEKVRQPGRFEDTHEYYIVYTDAEGKETRREKVSEHTNEFQEGFRDEDRFTATIEEKDGFKFEKLKERMV